MIRDLNRAARSGSLSAAFILGRLCDEGWGVLEDQQKAFRWYLAAAEGGLPEALYFVGSAYQFGKGVLRNKSKAYKWFQRSAAAGDITGAYMAALAVLDGVGTKPDPKRGMVMLLDAAHRGSADAMDYLSAYHISLGQHDKAKQWARRALKAGDEVARLRLAQIERESPSSPQANPTVPPPTRANRR